MKDFGIYIQALGTVTGSWFHWFMGDRDNLLNTLITFVLLEYLSSMMCAVKDKALAKEVSFPNICGKVLIFVLVGAGHVLDSYVIGGSTVLRTAVISFYTAVEGVALLKNAVHLGLPVPQLLYSIFEELLSKASDKHEYTNTPGERKDSP